MRQSTSTQDTSAVLVVAPVGAYWKRVEAGIRIILSGYCKPKPTEVHVYLLVASKWAKEDARYVTECVEPLQKEYATDVWKSEFAKYHCETVYLNPEDQNENTIWLFRNLLSFFKKGADRRVFVDLTSAPREWVYSAYYVSNFFSNLDFYFVKSKRSKSPGEYSPEEKKDEGMVPEYPISGVLQPPLSRWLRPREPEAKKDNIPYKILKLMYEIVSQDGKRDISELSEVAIKEDELLKSASNLAYYKGKPLDDVQKGITRYLSDIHRFALFKRVRNMIVIDRKGVVLMQALFGGRFSRTRMHNRRTRRR